MTPATQDVLQWKLSELLAGLPSLELDQEVAITGLALDSKAVEPGDLFLAIPGNRTHGLEYVDEAINRGAVAVLWQPNGDAHSLRLHASVPSVQVPDLNRRIGTLAARFYRQPSSKLTVIGITGTDGKTSVSQFVAQALDQSAERCAVIGTLGYGLYGQTAVQSHTTPDAIRLQKELAAVYAQGATAVLIEVSSHALEQFRVAGTAFDIAVFTNLSRDHFDYHRTLEAYAAAKRRLFYMPGLRYAVLNLEDEYGRELYQELRPSVDLLGYSTDPRWSAQTKAVVATRVDVRPCGLRLQVATPWGEGELRNRLLGRFNASNLLAAVAILLALDVPFGDALSRLAKTRTVPGRMEALGGAGKPLVVVDYAHTPAALEHVLIALREHCEGRLLCVFGCGGDRDPGKRPLMGRVAEEYADAVIITDDNPRTESPRLIAHDILSGLTKPAAARVVHDRRQAIALAVTESKPEDAVLIAGKGHEEFQLIGATRQPLSDRQQVLTHLNGYAL